MKFYLRHLCRQVLPIAQFESGIYSDTTFNFKSELIFLVHYKNINNETKSHPKKQENNYTLYLNLLLFKITVLSLKN